MMTQRPTPHLSHADKPLVTVMVCNFNYGRFLGACLESIYQQTYENVEIIFSDNASTDESWQVALDFQERHPELITINRNRHNYGTDANFNSCFGNTRGKYMIFMSSDDIMGPTYIEKCVRVMEENHELGFVMVHRTVIDEHGTQTTEAPFYDKSCIIPGEEQAAVYMVAAVNPSVAQVMYNRHRTERKYIKRALISRWYGCRVLDFNMCMEYPMAYIAEPLLQHRIHGKNDSLSAADNLMEVIGPYVLSHQFVELAKLHGMDKVVDRLPEAVEKWGLLALRYSVRAIRKNDEKNAKRYYHLAAALAGDLEEDPIFQKLTSYWGSVAEEKAVILEELVNTDNFLTRTVSYAPPPGSVYI
ncbi:glycosyltransferase family A protein [Terasakiella sp. SH-1]|uniref:glycosyltransferase family 2 protein n=1 Tax=Terasakiella sp. SH-1 TaxID=2560057 RepID=UPI00107338DE|nr:glycosyltransferase family A protein [Terasakiella sp. SH-1]